jgi:cytidylate kinase
LVEGLEVALALELALALGELELELELELEHPAVPSRPAATTVAPSRMAGRVVKVFTRLKVFTTLVYAIRVTRGQRKENAQVNDA